MTRLPLVTPLSDQQIEVAARLSQGHTVKQIARALGISHRTVEKYAENAANRIPGCLPRKIKLIAWFRGAGMDILAP